MRGDLERCLKHAALVVVCAELYQNRFAVFGRERLIRHGRLLACQQPIGRAAELACDADHILEIESVLALLQLVDARRVLARDRSTKVNLLHSFALACLPDALTDCGVEPWI